MDIERLGSQHVRATFDCGVAALDEFIRRYARQNDERGLSRTYVAVQSGTSEVRGYVTVRVGEVACADLPAEQRARLPRYPVPVLHVARLAVDTRARGQGLGEQLLIFALCKGLAAADEVGLWGAEVLAKDEAARRFYERYGFAPLVDDDLHLYVSLRTVARAFA